MFTLYHSDFIGNPGNCSYPYKVEITDSASLAAAVGRDYVCAEYKNNYRNGDNFIGSDCLPVDCDNDHSENPEDWILPADVMEAFPGVTFAVHYSRSNMREKNGKPARPKFHVLFPIDHITDAACYSDMKKLVNAIFPYFDTKALDAARFFFGTNSPEVEIYEGGMNLSEFLESDDFDVDMTSGHHANQVIPEGSRNATMSRFAGRVIKKYGDGDAAYQCFLEEAAKCSPPLGEQELFTIWHSAQRFFAKVQQQDGYVPPEVYNDPVSYKPGDYSDVGQAEVLAKYFSCGLRYSPATHFIRYNEHYWQESEPGAQAVAHELTRRQLTEATKDLQSAMKLLMENGGQEIVENTSKSKAESLMNNAQLEAYRDFLAAKVYQSFAIRRRDSKNITATLKESHPMLEISPRDLDADCFLLCTPAATYDLRKGMAGAREHSPEDFITKMTSVSPSDKCEQLWLDSLNLIFCSNQELIDYVQMICGLAAIGKVYVEALIIAYGGGRNGKSTFWNAVSRVLGLYSGNISADTLTVGCRRNIKPEMAEVKGKRLLIAAEMQEGARLNDSTVKQLCSTDDVFAEKKYKDPFSFTPCHTLVLYTNHLPKVSASDDGIWRRLIVIPFDAKIEGSSDIKNYGEYLYQNAGESILAWIIDGAKKVIALDYKIPVPECVQKAIAEYRAQNDWFGHFLEDKCELGASFRESSSALYQTYRNYCIDTNEYIRSTTDFYAALEAAGYGRIKAKNKRFFTGLRLKIDDGDFEDFLN
ncbi:phage/plasmid primase, P4 family [Acetanaerobacterium elongatum]|uniref:Phage/plasmid primase, P4 family, C-terminal domain-containing protein n=1 Tax=Acetanaerobacterium elongatum TaxID=258515 RepID=A0A1G9Y6V1_9FIRM|nr:phage/plasmid primase, P4 family [Acetanaerobacterium elongatum]SDN04807.1 phage/plasmid primase, P4 family, C-terminal domain-containing protein [Acetanaerobacterium elongatum]